MDNHPNINCWYCGAEQTDLVKRLEELNNAAQLHVTMENGLVEKVKQLEAERSEVRNKVIEECIDSISGLSVLHPKKVHEILNSLKTK